jgi:quercetin dioxygenase-like cupin family protein
MRAACRIGTCSAAALVLFWVGVVLGQQTAPTDYKGVDQQVLAAIDLAAEINSVQNRELRLSRATIAPGGHVGLHSHSGDPTIVYVLSGVLTNHHDDGTVQQFHSGGVFAEFGPGAHWIENKGPESLTFIVANIHQRN